jgi:hypothetical protein
MLPSTNLAELPLPLLPFRRFDSLAVDVMGGLLNLVNVHLLPFAAAGGLLKHDRDITAPIYYWATT